MKKFLCVLLTLAMLLTSMVFVVSAAEESNTEVIWISNCDTTAGNKGIAGYAGIDKDEKTEGEGSLMTKHAAGSYGAGGFMWQYGFDDPGVDVSGANYLYLDMYINDASVLSGNLQLELTSSGRPDAEESMYPGITLKDGWNTLEIPLALFPGDCDFTRLNYIRLFNAVSVTASKEVVVRIDNFRFECGDKISFKVNTESDTYHLMNQGSVGTADWGRFADAAGKIIFAFELPGEKIPYISNVRVATTLNGSQPALLVSSDCANWTTVFSANGADGAKSVYEDITGAIDFSKSNYVYIAVADSDTSNGNGGQIHNGRLFDVMISYSDIQTRATAEYYNFRVRTSSEESYLVSTNGTNHASQPHRYHDTTKNTVWKYSLYDVTELQNIYWTARLGGSNGCLIQVSLDGTNYTDVYAGSADSNTPYTFSLMQYIDVEALQTAAKPTIYIRIGDSTPEGGNGGQIYSTYYTTLTVLHNPPPATGLVGMVDRIFTEFKILSQIPFLRRLFKTTTTVE